MPRQFSQGKLRQLIGLHPHGFRIFIRQAAGRRYLIGIAIQRTTIRIIDLLRVSCRIRLPGSEHDLKARGRIVQRAIVKHRSKCIGILAAILPRIDAAVGRDRARMGQSREPMYGIDLVAHPLPGNTRRIRPEEPELQVLTSIEWLIRPVEQESLPVCILFPHLRHESRSPPTTRLVDIPGQLHHHDRPEFSGLDKIRRGLVIGAAPALGTDLYDLARVFHRFQHGTVVIHRLGQWLLRIGIPPRLDRFNRVQGMLKISRADHHRIDLFNIVQLIVIHAGLDIMPEFLGQKGLPLLPPFFPDVRHRDDVKIHFLVRSEEGGNMVVAMTVGESYHADAHSVIGADDPAIAAGAQAQRAHITGYTGHGALTDKVSASRCHVEIV